MRLTLIPLLATATLMMTGCSLFSDEDLTPNMEGERIAVLQSTSDARSTTANLADAQAATQTMLEPVWNNAFWPQAGGYANHAMQHVALSYPLKRQWSQSIGRGATKEIPLIAQPVMAEGIIATLDGKGIVKAVDADTGKKRWSTDAKNQDEDDLVVGGGLALASGMVFVTAGYNEAVALNSKTGDIIWRTTLSAPTRAAPTVADGRVFIVTLDNRTTALSATTGARLWQHQGLEEDAGLLGMASPAYNRGVVFAGYSSGEIYALRAENGSSVWSDNLSALTRRGSRASLSDIRALPVVDKGTVFVVSTANRMAAIDEVTGERLWEINHGGTQTPFVSGNRIFLIDVHQNILSLDRQTGQTMWQTALPAFQDMEDREDPIIWVGPVLAGDRLLTISSNGGAMTLDPVTGVQDGELDLSVKTSIPPIIAAGKLTILSNSGTLSQYR